MNELWDFVTSPAFAVSIISAAVASYFAAYAGAKGAQKIAERSRMAEARLTELRNTNAAIMLAASVCNTAIAFKSQLVKPMYEKYMQQKSAVDAALTRNRQMKPGEPRKPVEFEADFMTLSAPSFPMDALQKLLHERITVTKRPLMVLTSLAQSVHNISDFSARRNEFIERFKAKNPAPAELAAGYFGVEEENGKSDTSYPMFMRALYENTDNVIFFSALICEDLAELGHARRKEIGKLAPEVFQVEWTKPKANGLMPDEDRYRAWRDLKETKSASKRTRWCRIFCRSS